MAKQKTNDPGKQKKKKNDSGGVSASLGTASLLSLLLAVFSGILIAFIQYQDRFLRCLPGRDDRRTALDRVRLEQE